MANYGVPAFDGTRLRACRQDAGLSLNQLAKRVGMSSGMLSRCEMGKSSPGPARLAALARELKITPVDLVDSERLGQGLGSLRVRAGLEQKDIAERAGPDLSVAQYRNLEQGVTSRLRHADAEALARVFGVTVEKVHAAHEWDLRRHDRPSL